MQSQYPEPPNDLCFVCDLHYNTQTAFLISCSKCRRTCHHSCHRPPVPRAEVNKLLETGYWLCAACRPAILIDLTMSDDEDDIVEVSRPNPGPSRPSYTTLDDSVLEIVDSKKNFVGFRSAGPSKREAANDSDDYIVDMTEYDTNARTKTRAAGSPSRFASHGRLVPSKRPVSPDDATQTLKHSRSRTASDSELEDSYPDIPNSSAARKYARKRMLPSQVESKRMITQSRDQHSRTSARKTSVEERRFGSRPLPGSDERLRRSDGDTMDVDDSEPSGAHVSTEPKTLASMRRATPHGLRRSAQRRAIGLQALQISSLLPYWFHDEP